MPPLIQLRQATAHNLRGVDLDLPHGTWIAIVGPSGSGKTSLVFDTLVREGQHRYLSSLSPRARQHFGKLGRAQVASLTGLPPTIAIGQRAFSPNARSTVGTLTGTLDLLRLLFARAAKDPEGQPLSRSHFSFNHPKGACERCSGLGVQDSVDPELLVADGSKSIRDGALVPTLKSGYTVYSQVTLDVMETICAAHGFDVNTPWDQLSEDHRHVIYHGSKKLRVPFGKHSIESRMKWEGITARPREEGFYKGLVPVIEETLLRNRNPNILRFVRSVACEACGGSRLARAGREARVGDWTLPELLSRGVAPLIATLDQLPSSAVLNALAPELKGRLQRMLRLGLGHLTLERESTHLSGGEGQRLGLAAQLSSSLSGVLFALDEPTLGLHPSEQQGMREVLDELRNLGNTLAVIEHDPDMVRHGDLLVRVGPGAGSAGGKLVSCGPLPEDPLGPCPTPKLATRPGLGELSLMGARLHNLKGAPYTVQLGALNVVCGPSGAGKSSLVFGTLLPALTGRPGGSFDRLEGMPSGAVQALDARPIGRTSRSTPATWSGLFELVRKRFASTRKARQLKMGAGHFSYNNKEGRCENCEGLGSTRVGLHLLENVELPCEVCNGGRYNQTTLQVRLAGKSIADVLALTVSEALIFFADDEPIANLCAAMQELGLGHLPLGQPSNQLSRGESQRVKLATLLGNTGAKPSLLFLDEPDRGLHPVDVKRLLDAMDRLVDAGHTLVAISHHRHVWAAADYLVEVKDGALCPSPNLQWQALSPNRPIRTPAELPREIRLKGVRTNNLKDLDVSFQRGAMTVLCGVSGSGKSSLAFGTLAAEAWHRFAESLPFEVRRHVRRMPRPELDSCAGIGPTLSLKQGQAIPGLRSTVATQSGIGPLLRLLFSRAGQLDGLPCPFSAEHFSADRGLGACPECTGRGIERRCSEATLVKAPSRSLLDGALKGSKPGEFFSESDGQYIATLRAALPVDVDLSLPWNELSPETKQIALHGCGEKMFQVAWVMGSSHQEDNDTHHFENTWDGFLALVDREAARRLHHKNGAAWGTVLKEVECKACAGIGLNPEVREVLVGKHSWGQFLQWPLKQVYGELLSLGRTARQRPETPSNAATVALLPELTERLNDLLNFGLGHLSLGRRIRDLSASERQRLRLAGVLRSDLEGITLVLDEPSAGLQPEEVEALCSRLRELCLQGNTLVIVEHHPTLIRAADTLIELGPGAGEAGGEVIETGSPTQVLSGNGPTARALREESVKGTKTTSATRIVFEGVNCGPLHGVRLDLPTAGFVCLNGPSGSGKSTLLFEVVGACLESAQALHCDSLLPLEALQHFRKVHGQKKPSRKGALLNALKLMLPLQRFWQANAGDSNLPHQAFSFLSPKGRCQHCNGSGREHVAMDFLADLDLDCPMCEGQRYRPEVLAVHWQELNPAEFLLLSAQRLSTCLPPGKLQDGARALSQVGLGHLSFGRDLAHLSGGELQRLGIAKGLLENASPCLHLLDDPTSGLHPLDVRALLDSIRKLTERGDLVLAATSHPLLLNDCDETVVCSLPPAPSEILCPKS